VLSSIELFIVDVSPVLKVVCFYYNIIKEVIAVIGHEGP
jgi:hypothetical protein